MRGRCKRKKGILKREEERCGFFENRSMDLVEAKAQRDEGVLDFGGLLREK